MVWIGKRVAGCAAWPTPWPEGSDQAHRQPPNHTHRPEALKGQWSVSQTPLSARQKVRPASCMRPVSTRRTTGLPCRWPTLTAVASSGDKCTCRRRPGFLPSAQKVIDRHPTARAKAQAHHFWLMVQDARQEFALCSSCLTLVARRAAHAGLLRYRRPQPKSKSAACRECRLAGLCAASEAAIAASVFWLVLVDLAWRWSIRAFWTLTRESCPR